ncbi:MAG TPA: DNA repair protein RadC [Oceanobacillus sp.]|nr:DNA repair protein RadC [Oceanobacillus sp.]
MSSHEPKRVTMQSIPDEDRPRERLFAHGAAALSNAELLAIILRTGSAQENVVRLAERILAVNDGLQGLAHATPAELSEIKGLGEAKVAQIIAVLELSRRITVYRNSDRPTIRTSSDAAQFMSDMANLPQEHVRVILLDNIRRVVATPTLYIGTVNASVIRVSEVFREAIARNSPAIILAHNHPSGDPSPSPEDVELTRVLCAAGQLLDIQVLDHIIIAQQGWTSLKELGLGF